METLPFLLVALFALSVMPSALALKCYECYPRLGYTGIHPCSNDFDTSRIITCEAGLDRCMTVTGNITVPNGTMFYQLRNCSSSKILCNQDNPSSMCRILNSTGLMLKCNTECCEGDLCNGAVRISGLLASFAAIFLALFLNLSFSGFY
ncbi:uncharacterized protein LOC144628916 isoform X4 [Oculina patagonica]